jgi:hypothetical protein
MIKFLKNQDIQITTFSVAKSKVANNVFSDLLLASDGTYNFPLIIPVEECDYNFNSLNTGSFATINKQVCDGSIINENGFLACSPINDSNNPQFQLGLKFPSSSVFYPVGSQYYNAQDNPTNLDGTYQGQVYNTIKNMYYNNYNNAYNIFGFDGYDTSTAKLNLDDKFVSYTLNVTQSGDKIGPFSVIINNQTGDIVGDIFDDGVNNLYLSGSYFINDFEVYTNNTQSVVNYGITGLGQYLYYGLIST